MSETVSEIEIQYDPRFMEGVFVLENDAGASSIWNRLKVRILDQGVDAKISGNSIAVPWPDALTIIREFGSKSLQRSLRFRFSPKGEAKDRIIQFSSEVREAKKARETALLDVSHEEISQRLKAKGFTKRTLKAFQERDLGHLASMPHGANFSVPGAGKTTVTFALYLLLHEEGRHLFVVCPKSAFPAWKEIVNQCVDTDAHPEMAEPFTMLDGRGEDMRAKLASGATRFLISYDMMIRNQAEVANYLATHNVHLVLDESHRMKAGLASQRGAFLLGIAGLPARRDILSGTPMPQGASDMASQMGFLWPGQGFDLRIQRGAPPREVLGNLYVRTTKQELGLPPAERHYYDVDMAPGQLALYSIVRSEALRQFHRTLASSSDSRDYVKARKSVMRLLQLSINPTLALAGMAHDDADIDTGIVDKVLEEGSSNKIKAIVDHAHDLAKENKKCVIWTIFTDTIHELDNRLADLNPVFIHGGVSSGDENLSDTREGRLKRFHEDDDCSVLIANPAAAGEGISLHTVCHDAIYADRSYVSTHYLQSIDRIHRLGLPPGIETNIHIYRTRAPREIGSIDLSVSRRLLMKIRNLQELLNDPDLHQIALDEEEADDPIDYDVDMQDLVDLVEELEGRVLEATSEEL
ncbi:MAG: DEAD/DEAH box helicase [Marivibrio sp.]|uniref:DEAD/DEAH box helicase n=1 Tax=Marivibrio sp. TaxID=2039719 RepID=UPI0032EE69C4